MTDHRRFPYTSFPTGWYQIAWSHEVMDSSPVPLKYFNKDLVLYRGDSGALHLFDAFCPHLGAHLGFGGTVHGDTIQCPFHGWRYDENGRNCEIPYADKPSKARIATWQTFETGGIILAWYAADRSAPTWDPHLLPELDHDDTAYPAEGRLTRSWPGVRLKPQFIVENLVDAAHQKFVHGASEVPEIENYGATGPTFEVINKVVFGGGKKTWLTPDGTPVTSYLRTQAWGLGLAIARFDIDGSIHIQATTPVDDEHCDSRATVLLNAHDITEGKPSDAATRRFTHECKQYDRDLPIWENQRFVHPAPFPELERERFTVLRNWATQFYPEADPGNFGKYAPATTTEVTTSLAHA